MTTAVAGLAGAAAAMPGTAAAAVAENLVNVTDHGATGDGSTDDTAAIQAAIDAAKAAGGGIVFFPPGRYLVYPAGDQPALTVTGNGIRLAGASSQSSWLVKGRNGILLRMSGQPGSSHGQTHRRYCSVENLGFNGNAMTGLVVELYYNNNTYFRDVFISSNRGICIDAVECWDSRFHNVVIESSTGPAGSSNTPNVWLRNSAAASGWGYSPDNVNQLHFIGCRFEGFGTGGLWVGQGVNSTNTPNGIYIYDCKFETSAMQGGPHLKVDDSCKHVYATNIYCFAGGFATGYSTPQNIIAWAGSASALENVLIANGGTATVNSGVDLFSPAGSTAVLRNVVGIYITPPTGNHIYYEAVSKGDFRVENCYGNVGGQAGGAVPTRNHPNPPLRLVAGPVSDASFTHKPLDGTMAVDSTNNRLYVRVRGAWRSTPLS